MHIVLATDALAVGGSETYLHTVAGNLVRPATYRREPG